jgi:heme-degrading monooxygenase HmoA
MIRVFVRHPVADFAKWKKAYDDFDSERKGMGVVGHAVFKSADDPNDVTVVHDFKTLESAREFVESDRLRDVMSSAGVSGEPTIWFTDPA